MRDSGDSNWRDGGACLKVDPELFFPVGTTGPALLQVEEAKRVCRSCDVIQQCLRWALDTGAQGIWAATDEDERRLLSQQQRKLATVGG